MDRFLGKVVQGINATRNESYVQANHRYEVVNPVGADATVKITCSVCHRTGEGTTYKCNEAKDLALKAIRANGCNH